MEGFVGMTMLTEAASVTRRAATPADDQYLRDLFAESRDDLWVLPADVRTVLLDAQYRTRRHQLEAAHPEASYEIVIADGVEAGLLILDRGEDGVDVVQLAIARRYRGRGIAESVLHAVTGVAEPRPVNR
jgi:ribosomal protein S18 acetylase RimI-like enzyme